MEIRCTPNELKELLKKDVPVAATTDTINIINNSTNADIDKTIEDIKKSLLKNL